MKREEAMAELAKNPELVPLSDTQRKAFIFFWNEKKDYKSRQELVGSIPDLYQNRLRYKELLTSQDDVLTFNKIMRDGDTKF